MLSLVFKCISHVFQMYFSSHHILFPVSASSKWSKYNVLLSQVLHWQLRNWSHICLQPGGDDCGDDYDYADHGDWNDHDDDDDDSDEKHKWKWLFSLSKFNMLCWQQMINISQDPASTSLLRLTRLWWLWDDECSLCICMRVYLCVGVCFCLFFTPNSWQESCLTLRQCKIHMSQDILIWFLYRYPGNLKRATSIQESTQKIR